MQHVGGGMVALVVVLWAVNGRWALQTASGHTWHLAYAWMPWCFASYERARRLRVQRGLGAYAGAGACLAMLVYAGGIYPESCRTDRVEAGNLPSEACPTIGHSTDPTKRIAVPSSFYKIVVQLPQGGGLSDVDATSRVTAITLVNDTTRVNWVDHITSVDEIETLSGYDFLTTLRPDVEDAVEADVDRVAPTPPSP
jgi:hypothetical protein